MRQGRLAGLGSAVQLLDSREVRYIAALFVLLLLPFTIPNVGGSLTFTFTVGLTLGVWLSLRTKKLSELASKAGSLDVAAGVALVCLDYAENIYFSSPFGLVDQLAIFIGVSVIFYGVRRFSFFLLPSAYIMILIGGYILEGDLPQLAGLEVWQATLMTSLMNLAGISASVTGNIVSLENGVVPIALEIAGPCTGLKGILAFGTLSSMAVLDIKMSARRLIAILAIGFGGAFVVNLARLATIFVAAFYLGPETALEVHTYLGYTLFIAWVMAFWTLAFRYMIPPRINAPTSIPIAERSL